MNKTDEKSVIEKLQSVKPRGNGAGFRHSGY
jgi:hypothetical protein